MIKFSQIYGSDLSILCDFDINTHEVVGVQHSIIQLLQLKHWVMLKNSPLH